MVVLVLASCPYNSARGAATCPMGGPPILFLFFLATPPTLWYTMHMPSRSKGSIFLNSTLAQRARWKAAAFHDGLLVSDWVRRTLDAAAAVGRPLSESAVYTQPPSPTSTPDELDIALPPPRPKLADLLRTAATTTYNPAAPEPVPEPVVGDAEQAEIARLEARRRQLLSAASQQDATGDGN